ncbi:MAG: hypothetical protein NVV72_07845 [Asticcacaulis sp.]|nr:hypothetical protein [Asticcacaulis sp.]
MRVAVKLCLALLTASAICASGLVQAEGTPYDENAPAPKPVVKRKKAAAKPAPVLTTPAAPIPYAAAKLSPDMAKALTPEPPAALAPLPPPVAITPAPITMQPIADPPPPAPVAVPSSRSLPETDQISLKCETQVTEGKRFISQGVFYIDLFPSPVFPDEHADFKFLRVDPAHPSLIRQSICLDTLCPANVTGSTYYLVNRITKHGSALRITLDRSNGAFYAEEIDNKRIGKDGHRGETGYCTPQKLPNALF